MFFLVINFYRYQLFFLIIYQCIIDFRRISDFIFRVFEIFIQMFVEGVIIVQVFGYCILRFSLYILMNRISICGRRTFLPRRLVAEVALRWGGVFVQASF